MYRTFPPFHLHPPVVATGIWFGFDPERTARSATAFLSRNQSVVWASPSLGGWPRQPAVSSSLSCGPAVHLQLLSTSSHEDAVTFGYNVQTQLDRGLHPADSIHLQAHWEPPSRRPVCLRWPGSRRTSASCRRFARSRMVRNSTNNLGCDFLRWRMRQFPTSQYNLPQASNLQMW